jgi:membrane protease YdiL (CAAX protease family)
LGKLKGMLLLNIYLLRIVLLGAALQVAQICCVALVTLRLNTTISGLFLKPLSVLLPLLLPSIGVAVAIYWAGAHFLERRRLRELSRGLATTSLVVGVASGFLPCALVFAALAAHGFVTYAGFAGLDMVPAAALIFTAGVVFEELIFRGVILRIGEESLGTASALMLSAMLFAASHLGNDGVTTIGVIALFAGGITLGLTYVLSRNLWLPFGAHLGWNFALGALFGTAVSGHEAHGAFRFVLSGPDWISGGRFGPESSIYSMVFLVLLAIALWWHAARRSGWRSSQFRLRASYARMSNGKD